MPVVRRSALAFAMHPRVDRVQLVIHPDDADLAAEATAGLDLPSPVVGGDERRDSVRRGLDAIVVAGGAARVLIHDAARPLVSAAVIDRVLAALDGAEGAAPALPVTDTLVRQRPGIADEPVEREGLYRVQTPQGFGLEAIRAAHARFEGPATDDAGVARAAGLTVALVEGEERNLKLTTPEDFARAEALLRGGLGVRTGAGFDVHRFGPGDGLMLCGVPVPHSRGLIGHSDADVGLHALTDAILGALAEGDIGLHFPPSDPRWRGAASARFLEHARDLVLGRGGVIDHVDVTIICERPKVGPHREAMRARVADLLRLAPTRVSIKATTTERLGFAGRSEGIAAQAVATIRVPDEELSA